MSELGASVVQAIGFLKGFHGDVSKLVAVVEDGATAAGLGCPWGSTSFWGVSYSYYSHSQWMAQYAIRLYVEIPGDDQKPSRKAPWYAFFMVHFAPVHLGEPVAVWGLAHFEKVQDIGASMNHYLLEGKAPRILDRLTVEDWQEVPDPGFGLRYMHYRARPVVELCDEVTVRELVLQPLLAEVDSLKAEHTGR